MAFCLSFGRSDIFTILLLTILQICSMALGSNKQAGLEVK